VVPRSSESSKEEGHPVNNGLGHGFLSHKVVPRLSSSSKEEGHPVSNGLGHDFFS
jgi:hypothetical protein